MLLVAGLVRVQDERGQTVDPKELERKTIGKTMFKVESATVSTPQRIEIRKLMQKLEIPAKQGEPIAAALLAAGVKIFRTTAKRGFPRGIFCGIGRCTDCVLTVDGRPNVRACVTPVRPGMNVQTQEGLGRWSESHE